METTTQSNQLVTEKEIVDVIYEAGQMPIKTLWRHFRGRMGRDFMAKVYAVAESEQYEEDGKTVTYIMLKAETIIKYGLATETCLWGHPASTTISEEDARRERREWNRGAVRRGGGTDTGDGGTVCEQRRE